MTLAPLIIDNFAYQLMFDNDIIEDGVFLELVDPKLSGHGVVRVTFEFDVTGQVTVSMLQDKLPMSFVLRFLEAVPTEWPLAVV